MIPQGALSNPQYTRTIPTQIPCIHKEHIYADISLPVVPTVT